LSGPVFPTGNRQRTVFAVGLGEVEPLPGLRLVLPPPPNLGHRCGFLLGAVPEFSLAAGRLLPRVRHPPFDGSGARGHRGQQQLTEPLALAPRAALPRLDPPPLQGPSPPLAARPVEAVPGWSQ
jgi:hypothetical protein